jgi:hypothetical protein
MACQGQKIQLTGPIRKLQRKLRVVNTSPVCQGNQDQAFKFWKKFFLYLLSSSPDFNVKTFSLSPVISKGARTHVDGPRARVIKLFLLPCQPCF